MWGAGALYSGTVPLPERQEIKRDRAVLTEEYWVGNDDSTCRKLSARGSQISFFRTPSGGKSVSVRCGRTNRPSSFFYGTMAEFFAASMSRSCANTSKTFWIRARRSPPSALATGTMQEFSAKKRESRFPC